MRVTFYILIGLTIAACCGYVLSAYCFGILGFGNAIEFYVADGILRVQVVLFQDSEWSDGLPIEFRAELNPYGAYWRMWWWDGGIAPGILAAEFPVWVVAAVCGASAITVWSLRRRRRSAPGCCVHCGYDLTGNTSGRCPECGCAVAERVDRSGQA